MCKHYSAGVHIFVHKHHTNICPDYPKKPRAMHTYVVPSMAAIHPPKAFDMRSTTKCRHFVMRTQSQDFQRPLRAPFLNGAHQLDKEIWVMSAWSASDLKSSSRVIELFKATVEKSVLFISSFCHQKKPKERARANKVCFYNNTEQKSFKCIVCRKSQVSGSPFKPVSRFWHLWHFSWNAFQNRTDGD